jgi:chaperone modulatory protein CbpM
MTDPVNLLEARLLGEADWIAVDRLCRLCDLTLDAMVELADLGVVSPRGFQPDEWQLPATALPRLRLMGRLMHDLGVNVSGAALAADLLERQRRLERRLRELERHLHPARY